MGVLIGLLIGVFDFLIRKFFPYLMGKFGLDTARKLALSTLVGSLLLLVGTILTFFFTILDNIYIYVKEVLTLISTGSSTVTSPLLDSFYCLMYSSGIADAFNDLMPIFFTVIMSIFLKVVYIVSFKSLKSSFEIINALVK